MKGKRILKWMIRIAGVLLAGLFVYLTIHYFSFDTVLQVAEELLASPVWLMVMVLTYAFSFWIKAFVWREYVNEKGSLLPYWSGIHYALFMNHILPFKTGDAVRAGVLKGTKSFSWEKSVSSVVAMRVLDLGGLFLLAAIGTYLYMNTLFYIGITTVGILFVLALLLPFRLKKILNKRFLTSFSHFSSTLLSKKGVLLFGLIVMSWILEGFIIYSVGRITVEDLGFFESVWATSVAVVSGVFQITPGHIAGYESVQSYALTFVGLPIETGYAIAVVTHVFKFIYAYVTGLISFYLTPVSFSVVKTWFKGRE
ncbi:MULTISPECIES: lysylphosphatidylglycerol synthase transmembrane domain-containing protein [Pontibacillus]|uniref:Phosphatidylglycerol lysyltransferase n=1 Tax=Pontibacillus chungwhensis TaxID=265426 RepID=A0ABY8UV00_9BACI|nr:MULTISPECIES: lysylphosphatidylglycerol synthase transmembrane domain-containing protein [Pontibacillus]MCD5323781.1 flippase-like domain-containing protein [Pontibacillus sp. HN14]WIF97145.1 lysylphosphatidylglycerol synthase transmembrane domain-containing protein [Pontibacillus chungwhensis]